MRLDYAFFADSAVVPPDGKVYVLGGGFSNIALPQIPGRAQFALVAGFRFDASDGGRAFSVELRFVDGAGKLVLPPSNLQFQSSGPPPADRDITVPTVTFLAPMFGEPGNYAAEYHIGDRLLTQVPLHVEEQPPGATGPRPN